MFPLLYLHFTRGYLQVLRYLQQFDRAFEISQSLKFNTRVLDVRPEKRKAEATEQGDLGSPWMGESEWHVRSKDLVNTPLLLCCKSQKLPVLQVADLDHQVFITKFLSIPEDVCKFA